jgi:hypothetical protein
MEGGVLGDEFDGLDGGEVTECVRADKVDELGVGESLGEKLDRLVVMVQQAMKLMDKRQYCPKEACWMVRPEDLQREI